MARLTILMATYNGERFLEEQLNSLESQTFSDWDLWVSDDGSTDSTVSMLKKFAETHGGHEVEIVNGPRKGFVMNFLSLACTCRNNSEYFAFSDQDDVWQSEKLKRAVEWLETVPDSIPALYCTRTEIVDKDARSSLQGKYSPLMKIAPSFGNALVQSIAGGNTMVFNRSAKALIDEFGGPVPVPSHDWWMYLLVAGVGGQVYYDPTPTLKYRQHGQNLVGSNRSLMALGNRLAKFLKKQYKKFNETNLFYLNKNADRLTKENQDKLCNFIKARSMRGLPALRYLRDSGACRNGVVFNFALKIGAMFGKI